MRIAGQFVIPNDPKAQATINKKASVFTAAQTQKIAGLDERSATPYAVRKRPFHSAIRRWPPHRADKTSPGMSRPITRA
jgi:hypothetical protein